MRISDWSSDVCSSDLIGGGGAELQCWGGCTEQAVLEAVHADARPPRAVDGAPRTGFDAILFETCIAWIAAGEVMEGKPIRSEEHTSELQSLMRRSYAVFCLKKKKAQNLHLQTQQQSMT